MSATTESRYRKPAGWRSTPVGEYVSEFLGTFVLIAFGDGVVAMAVAALPGSGRSSEGIFLGSGDWLTITFGWAMAVTFAIYVAGGVSGAHINPAVSIALAARGLFPSSKVPGYIAAQVAGAFTGAALVWLLYKDAMDVVEAGADGDKASTFGIFATFPAQYFGDFTGPLITEIVGTAFLLLFVVALTDTINQPPRANLAPLIVGLAVFAIGTSYGANSGYAINPARDLGPRLFAWIAGWGESAMPGNYGNVDWYFWVPIVGPIVGGLIGVFLYHVFVHTVLEARGEVAPADVEARGRTVEDME